MSGNSDFFNLMRPRYYISFPSAGIGIQGRIKRYSLWISLKILRLWTLLLSAWITSNLNPSRLRLSPVEGVDLDDGIDLHSDIVYNTAKNNLTSLINDGFFVQDSKDLFYV